MNLTKLGFHKIAGAQLENYKLIKPWLLNALNMRNVADASKVFALEQKLSRLPKINIESIAPPDNNLSRTLKGIIHNIENQM